MDGTSLPKEIYVGTHVPVGSSMRWMGLSFWMYLCDTGIIQDNHHGIPRAASQEVIDLIARSLANIHNISGISTVEMDTTMGNYIDDMD